MTKKKTLPQILDAEKAKPVLYKCSRCNDMLPRESYTKANNTSRGLRAMCKDCVKARQVEMNKENIVIKDDRLVKLKGEANRNAILKLINNHRREFSQLLLQEMARVLPEEHVRKQAKSGWIPLVTLIDEGTK